ncbi:MAG: geranylgeranylglycerol-phosphate geranylgeranyltransferase [Bacteroidales bacterium]|nr:geranylgeranylglycerol-phosphate geranylgeranyltransferase [Bacteroidales bacterium]
MNYFLKLIRWQNLLIIILTQVLVRYAVIRPLAGLTKVVLISTGESVPLSLQLPLFDFILLVIATVMLAAGGYVINDYFDIRTDRINRGDVIVGKNISRRRAILWHNLLNIAGVAAGFYISYRVGYFWIGVIFMLASGLLYFYSATYKKQLLVGNLVVALLTAMVPFLVLAYELPAIWSHYIPDVKAMPSLRPLVWWVGGFSMFAFLTTLALEIIKDIGDFEGDSAYGHNSLPVVAGVQASRITVSILQAATLLLIIAAWYLFLGDTYTLLYIIFAISLPMMLSAYYLNAGAALQNFRTSAFYMRAVMISGVLYTLVLWVIVERGLIG